MPAINPTRWGVVAWVIVAAVIACCISFVVGGIVGEEWSYFNRYEDEKSWVEKRINDNPAFSHVEIRFKTDGGVWFSGYVSTQEDKDKLMTEVTRALGENRGQHVTSPVEVKSPDAAKP